MLKVWLREPHQSDDEAIKLMVDEEADVSDVLLKAPELLRVQQLKPSEIRAEFEDTVLSNRLLVSSVFEGKKEGTFVIRPRPGVVVPPNGVPKVSSVPAGRGGDGKNAPPLAQNNVHPPPSSRRNQFDKSPRVNSEEFKRTGSLGGDRRKPPVARSTSRGPTPPRIVGEGTPRDGKANFDVHQKERNITSRKSTPNRGTSVSSFDRRPAVRSRYRDPKNVASRFRQEAEKVRVPSKRNQVDAVCDSFKPQWGKPLCATCNHLKQAHWEAQKIKSSGVEPNIPVENDGSLSKNAQLRCPTPNENVSAELKIDGGNNNMNMANSASLPLREEY
ncbi:hypothetical protein C3747_14g392 [Trypanosoma cruzi]|uniref:Uncharacterized protein n=1 Tax=Trypanosoma cruzi TaxID=5693 RepID=A0A2V2XBA6_TRYCR|nr:hypothetical protein C3747_14g392 [Trypanosoma cruzi]